MFDPTLHWADILAIASIGAMAWQRVSGALRSIEEFMRESSRDRQILHQRVEFIEELIATKRRGVSKAQKVAEERMGK